MVYKLSGSLAFSLSKTKVLEALGSHECILGGDVKRLCVIVTIHRMTPAPLLRLSLNEAALYMGVSDAQSVGIHPVVTIEVVPIPRFVVQVRVPIHFLSTH